MSRMSDQLISLMESSAPYDQAHIPASIRYGKRCAGCNILLLAEYTASDGTHCTTCMKPNPPQRTTRQQKAQRLADDAGQWLRCHAKDGSKVFGVPSETVAGRFHLVGAHGCTCRGYGFRGACSHVDAVRLYVAQVRAQQTVTVLAPVDFAQAHRRRQAEQYAAMQRGWWGEDAA